MAEQYKRRYISAREFVSSWEKEIYELTNLDYFTYLLINDVASQLEKKYFTGLNSDDLLWLNSDELGLLAFNIGDSLHMFLEKNCLSSCPLNCPVRSNEKLDNKEIGIRDTRLNKFSHNLGKCYNKEQCLQYDILNYVVIDTVLDFYNYEMGVVLNESDKHLADLADFTLEVIIYFIRQKGQTYLIAARENAGMRFSDLIQNDDSEWIDFELNAEDDEDEDPEDWKIVSSGFENIVDEFKENFEDNFGSRESLFVIDEFREYISDFLEIKTIEEIHGDDLEEFFTIVLTNELLSRASLSLGAATDMLLRFLDYLEFQHDIDLKTVFTEFLDRHYVAIERTFTIIRQYQNKNSFIDFLLSGQTGNEQIVEGFFEIIEKFGSDFVIKDLHLGTYYKPVQFNDTSCKKLKQGDVLQMQIVPDGIGWAVVHIEMIYPAIANTYLY